MRKFSRFLFVCIFVRSEKKEDKAYGFPCEHDESLHVRVEELLLMEALLDCD